MRPLQASLHRSSTGLIPLLILLLLALPSSWAGSGGSAPISARGVEIAQVSVPHPSVRGAAIPNTDPFGLANGDRIEVVTASLNCRATPSTSGSILGTESSGQLGIIVNGSTSAGGYIWWYVAYDDGDLGWSAEGSGTTAYLQNVTNVTTTTNIAYNRTAAVQYAEDYWNVVTSDHYFWYDGSSYEYLAPGTNVVGLSGDDCAHFVSQAIGNQSNQSGGGLNIPSRVPPTYGEPAATNLGDLLINDGWAEPVSSVSQLMAGDLINYEWDEGDNTWDHVALYLGNGTVAMHTDSAFGMNWTLGGAYAFRFIHILNGSVPKSAVSISSFSASPSSIPVGSTTHLNVTASGGTQPLGYAYTGLPTGCASSDVASLTCTPTVAGTFNVSVTVSDGAGATAARSTTLTVTPATNTVLESVSVSPASSSIPTGGSVALSAIPVCAPGTCPNGVQYSWSASPSLGTLTSTSGPSTTFDAGATSGAVSVEVYATLNGTTRSASPASVTITAPAAALTAVSLTPTEVTMKYGVSVRLNASVTCAPTRCLPTTSFVWSLNNSALGSLSSSSGSTTLFTARNQAGVERLQVMATYNGSSLEANTSLMVVAPGTTTTGPGNALVAATISPENISLAPGKSVVLSALTTCSEGACPSGVVYVWGTNVSLGTLSATDEPSVTFTAGTAPGRVLVYLEANWNGTTVIAMTNVTISVPPSGATSSGTFGLSPLEIGLGIVGVAAVVALAVVLSRGRRKSPAAPEYVPEPNVPLNG